MSRSASRLFIALILLMLGSATCGYSGAGPIDPSVRNSNQNWSLPLRLIAECLTIPISTNDISDIRDVVLVAAAGAAILFLSFVLKKNQSLFLVDRNMTGLCLGVFLLAALSAIANGRFELSRGWIVRFVAGAIWAGLIATHLTVDRARMLIRLMLGLGGVTLVLAIIHRSERGVAHFSWPIGPITITAAMAGLWACMAIVWLAVHIRRVRASGDVALSASVAAISLYCLWETGRRSAGLGLGAGIVGAATVYLWMSLKTRRARIAIFCGVMALVIAAIGYVVNQANSTTREKSGPVALRFAYWRESASLIREHPLLGIGPDCFIVDMTNRIAPLRAVSPHFYHGTIDPYAHNEWLQAIVELGIPGGLAYVGLPILALFVASRQVRDPSRRDTALVAIAGLAAICVNEFGSINLRESILPVWYWTLLGVALLSIRTGEQPVGDETIARTTWAGLVGLALLFLLTGAADLKTSIDESNRKLWYGSDWPLRLLSRKSLSAQASRAGAFSLELLRKAVPLQKRSCNSWQKLYSTIPTYPSASMSYVNFLLISGNRDQAIVVLREILSNQQDPYDPSANKLYASFVAYPAEQFRCVQRALRSGSLDSELKEILGRVSPLPSVQELLTSELSTARQLVANESSTRFADATIEILRINAFIKEQSGATGEAISDQRLAAECYRHLERTDNLYRRRTEAEVDAYFALAGMIYEHDRANFHQAYAAICEAERLAVLGIGHEWVAKRDASRGFVIGEVMPTEFPERLRPMWRLSALLHIVQGDDRDLDYRVYFSLPPTQWTEPDLHRELAQLARTAYEYLGKIPEDKRPAHYSRLPDMIRRYEATANDGLKQGNLSR